jgi:hypothetical protein
VRETRGAESRAVREAPGRSQAARGQQGPQLAGGHVMPGLTRHLCLRSNHRGCRVKPGMTDVSS